VGSLYLQLGPATIAESCQFGLNAVASMHGVFTAGACRGPDLWMIKILWGLKPCIWSWSPSQKQMDHRPQHNMFGESPTGTARPSSSFNSPMYNLWEPVATWTAIRSACAQPGVLVL